MSGSDETLKSNAQYASGFSDGNLPRQPALKLAVVACMDARVDVTALLGLKNGDAHIIRNAGGIVTEDAMRSLIISHRLVGTREIMIINHTDCGMLTFKDSEFRDRLIKDSGTDCESPTVFHAFTDMETNVREQIQKVKSHPWLPDTILVRGFIYDVKKGSLSEVTST